MSSNQGWPKDTSPNVIARSKQVAKMTKTEAVEDLRSAQLDLNERLWRHRFASLGSQIAADPVATEMQTLGSPLQKPDIQLILELFVYLNNEALDMERLLNSAPLDRRSFLLQQFEVVVKSLFKGRQIIDEGLFLYFTKNPDELRNYLALGFTSSRTMWAGLQSAAEKTKFLKDVLDSPKGYPKTARSVDDWSPPRAVNLTSALNHWLDGYNNTSVFSGMSVTVTETNREQFRGITAVRRPRRRIISGS